MNGYIFGRVTAFKQYPVVGATVTLLYKEVPIFTTTAQPTDGHFLIIAQPGEYKIKAEVIGYRIGPEPVTVTSGRVVQHDLDWH